VRDSLIMGLPTVQRCRIGRI